MGTIRETVPLLKKQILRDDVKNYLTDVIMRGIFKPGERLVETQIAKELGISQAPVREAIHDLERMGIVVSKPYKGTYVRKLSLEDLKNVYLVRAELEGLAIRIAVPIISDVEIQELEKITEQMLMAANSADMQNQIVLDIKFHEAIIKASRNDILERAWETVSISHWTFLGTYQYPHGNSQLVERHQPILEAIRSRDHLRAEELMRKHFLELRAVF